LIADLNFLNVPREYSETFFVGITGSADEAEPDVE